MNIRDMDFHFLLSFKDYWYATISAIIGSLIGIRWTIHQFKKQRNLNQNKLYESLTECIQFNIDRLNQARCQLNNNEIPNYPLDTIQFNYLILQSHDYLSPNLLRNLNWQRYQLEHITLKFIFLNYQNYQIESLPMAYMTAHIASLLQHIDVVLREISPLIQEIETERLTRRYTRTK